MRLVIVGGGGFRVPLVHGALIAEKAPVRVDELVLVDVDAVRLATMKRMLTSQADQAVSGPRPGDTVRPASTGSTSQGSRNDESVAPEITTSTDLREGLTGADVVFCAYRVGGTKGRIADERVALELGVLGQETVGAGGLSYALRTVPVALDIAATIAEVAPTAFVINFTNPAGIVTEAMQSVLGDRVAGICDTPIGMVRRALALAEARSGAGGADTADEPACARETRTRETLGAEIHDGEARTGETGARDAHARERQNKDAHDVESRDSTGLDIDYIGLNHLGWLRALRIDGVDALPDLLSDETVLEQLEEARTIGIDWTRALGALPNEYLFYYYRNREALAAIDSGSETRGEQLDAQQGSFYARAAELDGSDALALWRETLAERESTYMAESRDEGVERDPADAAGGGYQVVALDLMAAIVTGRPARMILGVANRGTVPELPDDAVVEVLCEVDADGIRPRPIAPLRLDMLGLMAQQKAAERLIIRAVRERSADLAWQGFALHPLVDSPEIGRRLLEGYRDRIPEVAAVFAE